MRHNLSEGFSVNPLNALADTLSVNISSFVRACNLSCPHSCGPRPSDSHVMIAQAFGQVASRAAACKHGSALALLTVLTWQWLMQVSAGVPRRSFVRVRRLRSIAVQNSRWTDNFLIST